MRWVVRTVPSPLGPLVLAGDGERLNGLYLPDHRHAPPHTGAMVDEGAFDEAAGQLAEFFAGERRAFDLVRHASGTVFQRQVWGVLDGIPFGTTMTYAEVAGKAGVAGSARAVGHAVGRNPISIIIPCHRVVGARGVLTGYAGGLDAKRWLLDHERALGALPRR